MTTDSKGPEAEEDSDSARRSELAHAHLSRLMGLVVALRFLNWGGMVAVLCALLLVESTRYPGLLGWLTLPTLLSFYLLATGQVLLMVRLVDWPTRVFALGPLFGCALLAIPVVRSTPVYVALCLGVGLWLYLRAFSRQAQRLEQGRTQRWFERLAWAVVGLTVLALVSGKAAELSLFGGMFSLAGMLAGWRIWLLELRLAIADQELLQGN